MIIETMTLATAFLALLASLVGLWKSSRNGSSIQRVEISVDGRMTELKELIAKSSHAEGVIEGKATEKAEHS